MKGLKLKHLSFRNNAHKYLLLIDIVQMFVICIHVIFRTRFRSGYKIYDIKMLHYPCLKLIIILPDFC